jgi:phage terminase Nu1 subunit (DNA packaging protein)
MVDGRPKIADAGMADREWSANTLDPGRRAAPLEGKPDDAIDYAEARRRREVELWRQARVKRLGDEIALAERQGELVSVDEAKAEIVERYTRAKTKLLALPSRIKQRVPGLTIEHVTLIESMVREALEELAADA